MVIEISLIALALVVLFFGAEGLVRGSAALALKAGLSPLMVGLTVVAFGTSAPELVVSIESALAGQGDIAVGNVVGSNSFNIGIILGLTALICPIPVHLQVLRLDAPLALGVAVLVPLLLLDASIGRLEGAGLLAGIVAYTLWNVWQARRSTDAAALGDSDLPGAGQHAALSVALLIGGLLLLVLGSRLLVSNAVSLAQILGVSDAVIGLTIIAAGTSMPEVATSVVAAIRRQPDIAIGNVIGSNVFNVLGILGIASLLAPLEASGVSALDHAFMVGFSLLLLPLLYTGRLLHRVEGAVLLAGYGAYLWLLWPAG